MATAPYATGAPTLTPTPTCTCAWACGAEKFTTKTRANPASAAFLSILDLLRCSCVQTQVAAKVANVQNMQAPFATIFLCRESGHVRCFGVAVLEDPQLPRCEGNLLRKSFTTRNVFMSSLAQSPVSVNISRPLTGRFYHPELDVLRFFAFFLAFLHHSLPHHPEFYSGMGISPAVAAALAAVGATGAFGVNLFFLLSSYLITELLIRERHRFGHIDLRAFYIRRVLRIWPLYFFFLAFAWALQWIVPSQHIGGHAA